MNENIREPLVSVVIPTYNNEKTIATCLKSIKKQCYKKTEIIVVDEYSKDKTREIAKKYGEVFLKRGERSLARNFGIKKAKGEFILVIDSDMELTSNVIKECVAKYKEKEAVVIPENSIGSGFWTECRILDRLCTTAPDQGDNSVEAARFFSKKVILSVGGYDSSMTGVEDWDLQQRLIKKGYKIKRVKSHIIHHEGTISILKTFKKKMYYGKAFLKYKKRHPRAFKEAFIRTAYLRNWHKFIRDPLHALGLIVLKFVEGTAVISGMLVSDRI